MCGGLLRAGWTPDGLILAARREERAQQLVEAYGVECVLDVVEAIKGRRVLVIAVKPKDVRGVLERLAPEITAEQVVVSLAAGVPIKVFDEALPYGQIVRAMPNTPALVDQAITAFSPGFNVGEQELKDATAVLEAIGSTLRLEENLMDAVTAVSGSGPAYVYLLAEALTEAAIREGLPRHAAESLVHQTLRGAGALLAETEFSPTKLRAQVTSPGGTTAAAVHVLEEGGFRAAIEDAVRAASQRARELGEAAEKEE